MVLVLLLSGHISVPFSGYTSPKKTNKCGAPFGFLFGFPLKTNPKESSQKTHNLTSHLGASSCDGFPKDGHVVLLASPSNPPFRGLLVL